MKHKIAPWVTALFCAIFIHILIIEISDSQHWFDIDTQPSNFELFLLPQKTPAQTTKQPVQTDTTDSSQPTDIEPVETPPTETTQVERTEPPVPLIQELNADTETLSGKQLSEQTDEFDSDQIIDDVDTDTSSNNVFEEEMEAPSPSNQAIHADRPELLDLSKVTLSPDVDDTALEGVFSEELRDKISASKKAQQEYLESLTKEAGYPITKDADGTRYANIKGVCWRLPKEGSNEGWAIVFDGCGVKSKLFHFELNISPSILTNEILGPDSPFNLDQQAK